MITKDDTSGCLYREDSHNRDFITSVNCVGGEAMLYRICSFSAKNSTRRNGLKKTIWQIACVLLTAIPVIQMMNYASTGLSTSMRVHGKNENGHGEC